MRHLCPTTNIVETFITRNFRRKKLFIRKTFPLNKIQQVKKLSLLSLKVFPIRKVVSHATGAFSSINKNRLRDGLDDAVFRILLAAMNFAVV